MEWNFLEIFGTIVGLVYLWLEYKASIYLWIASVVMPAINLFVYFNAGLYADFAMDIYYLVIAIYGWILWRYGLKKKDNRQGKVSGKEISSDARPAAITHLPFNSIPVLGLVFAFLFVGIAQVLILFTNSTVPWLDSFTTSLSIIGMWVLARKHLEQWLVWIVVDIVSAFLYAYKELYFYCGLYTLYIVVAIFGYLKWKKMME